MASSRPIWQHASFTDVFDADEFLPPSSAAVASGLHGLSMPLSLAAQLLQASLSHLGSGSKSAAAAAIEALRFGEELSKLMPVDGTPLTPRLLLKILNTITVKLRAVKDGEMIVVPATWLSSDSSADASRGAAGRGGDLGVGVGGVGGSAIGGGGGVVGGTSSSCSATDGPQKLLSRGGSGNGKHHLTTLLLALRRCSETTWDVAVCTASAGQEYHPRYREPLRGSDFDLLDPVLTLRSVPSRLLVDSAPWLALYRSLVVPYSSAADGSRNLYEVVLPYLAQMPLPAALGRSPPPPANRRAASLTGDRSRAACALEAVGGLLMLSGLTLAAARGVVLELRATLMRGVAAQLEALEMRFFGGDYTGCEADAQPTGGGRSGAGGKAGGDGDIGGVGDDGSRTAAGTDAGDDGDADDDEDERHHQNDSMFGDLDDEAWTRPPPLPALRLELPPASYGYGAGGDDEDQIALSEASLSTSPPFSAASAAASSVAAVVSGSNSGGQSLPLLLPSARWLGAKEVERLRAACRGFARYAAAYAAAHKAADGGLSVGRLREISAIISRVSGASERLLAQSAGFVPPQCAAAPPAADVAAATAFPFFGRLLREPSSVEDLAGTAPPLPFLRPVQLTSIMEEVLCAHDAVVAMQQALYECTLLAAQSALVPNSAALRVALLQQLVTETIPLPLPLDHEERPSRCFWASEPLRYETQAQLLRLLALLGQHHGAATSCLELTRELDAARIVATACLAAVADAVMRTRACDTPSTLSDHYAGRAGGPSQPFGVDHFAFVVESETLKFTEPSLLVARGMVLDYFASVRRVVPPSCRLFRWEYPAAFGRAELLLVGQLCAQIGFPTGADAFGMHEGGGGRTEGATAVVDESIRASGSVAADEPTNDPSLPLYLTGELPELLLLFPELGAFRDLNFLFKLFMCPESAMLPQRAHWRPSDAALVWSHRRGSLSSAAAVSSVPAASTVSSTSSSAAPAALVVSGFGREALNLALTDGARGRSAWPSVLQEIAARLGFGPAAARGPKGVVFRPRAPPSGANPSALLGCPHLTLRSEDEVLAVESDLLLGMQQQQQQQYGEHGGDDDDGGGGDGSGAGGAGAATPLSAAATAAAAAELRAEMRAETGDSRPPLSARDAELLLSYLTAPYLRIPLLLQFFADQQRLPALAHARMQEVLEAALFEPGAWQEEPRRVPPTCVPLSADERSRVLATPLGLLFNELTHSPSLLLDPLERLLDMALDLDTGASGGQSARILYFVTRLIVRVESHALLLLRHAEWAAASSATEGNDSDGKHGQPPPSKHAHAEFTPSTAGRRHAAAAAATAAADAALQTPRRPLSTLAPSPAPSPAASALQTIPISLPPSPPGEDPPSPAPSFPATPPMLPVVPHARAEYAERDLGAGVDDEEGVSPSRESVIASPPNVPPPVLPPPQMPQAEPPWSTAAPLGTTTLPTAAVAPSLDTLLAPTPSPSSAPPSAFSSFSTAAYTADGYQRRESPSASAGTPPRPASLELPPGSSCHSSPRIASSRDYAAQGDTAADHEADGEREGAPEDDTPSESSDTADEDEEDRDTTEIRPRYDRDAVRDGMVGADVDVAGSLRQQLAAGEPAATAPCETSFAPQPALQVAPSRCEPPPLPRPPPLSDQLVPPRSASSRVSPPPRSRTGWRVVARGLDPSLQLPSDRDTMCRRLAAIRYRLDAQVFPLLEKWFARASRSKDVHTACVISAHLAMLLKNKTSHEIGFAAMTTLLASHIFLNHNFAWDTHPKAGSGASSASTDSTAIHRAQQQHHQAVTGGAAAASVPSALARSSAAPTHSNADAAQRPPPRRRSRRGGTEQHELGIPQTQIFDLFQRHRRTILARLRNHPQEAAEAMEAVTRVVTFTGTRLDSFKHLERREWIELDAERNAGRFVMRRAEPLSAPAGSSATVATAATDAAAASSSSSSTSAMRAPSSTEPANAAPSSSVPSEAAGRVESFGAWLAHQELGYAAQQEVHSAPALPVTLF